MRSGAFSWLRARRGIVIVAVALAVVSVGTAFAGNGRLANLQLGIANTIDGYLTTLTGSFANGNMLQVTNTNTTSTARGLGVRTSGGPGVRITVPTGRAPIAVNAGAGKATNLNADKLDGTDSSGFVQGVGKVSGKREYVALGSRAWFTTSLARFTFFCGTSTMPYDDIRFINDSGANLDYWVDSGGANPAYGYKPPMHEKSFDAYKPGDLFAFEIGAGSRIATVTVSTANFGSACLWQIQAVESN